MLVLAQMALSVRFRGCDGDEGEYTNSYSVIDVVEHLASRTKSIRATKRRPDLRIRLLVR
jgi:hypothetical protein